MSEYVEPREVHRLPRLPIDGALDLTYRCNNNCRHCWLRISPESSQGKQELTLGEIESIVDQARQMGCRLWSISGGEPMLRSDFPEILDYITSRSATYALNTNGTLITPRIAQILRRKGHKMVALYGATAEVHDHITRNPGSFAATMRGIAYLKEADAGFTVQLVPMRDNHHQFPDMVCLAQSLSPRWKVGASWLYLRADGDPDRNREIMRQRLSPREVIELDRPSSKAKDWLEQGEEHHFGWSVRDDRLFAACIAARRDFHIDPYGQMTFCRFIQDPALRYDLRQGRLQECWEEFIPSLADKVRGGREYLENCAACELREGCRWCPVHGYLEHHRFSAPVEYLCALAREARHFQEEWQVDHRRYYGIAGLTVQVESDLPLTDATFHPRFRPFQLDAPGADVITIRHHFALPDLDGWDLGEEIYRRAPWAICRKGSSWIYLGMLPAAAGEQVYRVAVFNRDHTKATLYNSGEDVFRRGSLDALTMFPTDQIVLSRVLADREGCYLHASGAILEGKGLLFVGHSGAGKSTMVRLLQGRAEILSDDRVIVRRWPDGFKIHGTWSHGEVPHVSPASAPLRAVLFLHQARQNRLVALDHKQEVIKRILACLIKPIATADWWDKMLPLVGMMARELACYEVHFDKSGQVVELLRELVQDR